MNTERLLKTRDDYCRMLSNAILEFVKEYGENYSDKPDYWADEFGICEEDGNKVTKVLDFFGNAGCESITQRNANPDIDMDSCGTFDGLLEIIDDNFTHNAFLQLYIEVDGNGIEELKYYCLYNDGVSHSDTLSEPEYGFMRDLNLADIENIIYVIHNTFQKK